MLDKDIDNPMISSTYPDWPTAPARDALEVIHEPCSRCLETTAVTDLDDEGICPTCRMEEQEQKEKRDIKRAS